MKTEKQVLTASAEHSRENTCTGVSFLINIVAAYNLNLSLFKKRLWRRCFPDSYPNYLTTTFLALMLWSHQVFSSTLKLVLIFKSHLLKIQANFETYTRVCFLCAKKEVSIEPDVR